MPENVSYITFTVKQRPYVALSFQRENIKHGFEKRSFHNQMHTKEVRHELITKSHRLSTAPDVQSEITL
jgi:hypothetical protein